LVLTALAGTPEKPSVEEAEKLIKDAQNPIAKMVSVPFQNNFNLGYGPRDKMQYVLNIQPVMPVELPSEWVLIVRHILPVIMQTWPLYRGGLGDLTTELFVTPPPFGPFMFGVGPSFEFPTASYESLGAGKFTAGPGGVVVYNKGKILAGALVNNLWSYAGSPNRVYTNTMTIQPFFNYNLPERWFVFTSPIITANWQDDRKNCWNIPVGGGAGKLVFMDKMPVNITCQGLYNLQRPANQADWTIRLAVQFLFPEK
jgi:hypothetical protein